MTGNELARFVSSFISPSPPLPKSTSAAPLQQGETPWPLTFSSTKMRAKCTYVAGFVKTNVKLWPRLHENGLPRKKKARKHWTKRSIIVHTMNMLIIVGCLNM